LVLILLFGFFLYHFLNFFISILSLNILFYLLIYPILVLILLILFLFFYFIFRLSPSFLSFIIFYTRFNPRCFDYYLFFFSFLIVKNFVQDFFSSVGSFRSHDQGCWFRILVQFNFDVSFLFHHLTLNYWALSFLFFSLSFLWGYLKSHVSQVNLSCFGFFQCFFF